MGNCSSSKQQEPPRSRELMPSRALHRDLQRMSAEFQSLITVTVEMLDGESLEIRVSPRETAGKACAEIAKRLTSPRAVKGADISLSFGGGTLDHADNLEMYNIEADAILHAKVNWDLVEVSSQRMIPPCMHAAYRNCQRHPQSQSCPGS